jgi:hypothetical protein
MWGVSLVAGKPAQTKLKIKTVSALLPAVNHNAHEIATDYVSSTDTRRR